MLADFCFADLFLYAPGSNGRWIVLAQVRPLTSQTLYAEDWVGAWATEDETAVLSDVQQKGEIVRGEIEVDGDSVHVLGVPVMRDSRVIGVLTREWSIRMGRLPGELEMTYIGIFERFAEMIATGVFPFASERSLVTEKPRVGDGVMVVDADARVRYASPNAVSALHRVGISANAVGLRLAELGFDDSAVRAAFEMCEPITEEVQQTPDVTLVNRCIPLMEGGAVVGGVLLVRDVSELRLPRPTSPVEGRHDPRDPPSREEQPADDLVAPAVAGTPFAVGGGQSGDRRVGTAHPHDRARPRDAVAGGR